MYGLKNNIMKFFMLSGLLVCQLNAMYRAYELTPQKRKLTPQELITRKTAFERLNKEIEKKIEKEIEKLDENSVLICQKDTFKCIPVEKNIVQLSDKAKEMLSVTPHSISIPYDIGKIKFVFDVIKECETINKLQQDKQKKEWQALTEKLTDLSLEQLVDTCNCAFFLKFECCTIKEYNRSEEKEEKIDIFAEALLLKIRALYYEIRRFDVVLAEIARWGSRGSYYKSSLEESLEKYEQSFNELPDLSIFNRIDQENLKRGSHNTYFNIFSYRPRSEGVTNLSRLQKKLTDKKTQFNKLIKDFIPVCQEGASNCVRVYKDVLLLSSTIRDSLEASGFDEKSLESLNVDNAPPIVVPSIIGSSKDIDFVFDFANRCIRQTETPSKEEWRDWQFLINDLMELPLEKLVAVSRCAFYFGFECCDIKNNEENMLGKKEINIFSEALLKNILKHKQEVERLYAILDNLFKNSFIQYTPTYEATYAEEFETLKKCEKELNVLPDYNILNQINKDSLILASQKLYKQVFPSDKDNLLSLQKYLNTKKDECKSLIIRCRNKNKGGFFQRWFGW